MIGSVNRVTERAASGRLHEEGAGHDGRVQHLHGKRTRTRTRARYSRAEGKVGLESELSRRTERSTDGTDSPEAPAAVIRWWEGG